MLHRWMKPRNRESSPNPKKVLTSWPQLQATHTQFLGTFWNEFWPYLPGTWRMETFGWLQSELPKCGPTPLAQTSVVQTKSQLPDRTLQGSRNVRMTPMRREHCLVATTRKLGYSWAESLVGWNSFEAWNNLQRHSSFGLGLSSVTWEKHI